MKTLNSINQYSAKYILGCLEKTDAVSLYIGYKKDNGYDIQSFFLIN